MDRERDEDEEWRGGDEVSVRAMKKRVEVGLG